MKTLRTIQKLAKLGKILSTIVFIFCLIGAIGSAVGIVGLAVIPDGLKLGGVTIHSIIEKSSEVNTATCYTAMAVGLIICTGEAILSKLAQIYFKNELSAGTPFTLEGANELRRLGICAICIPICCAIVAGIVYSAMRAILGDVAQINMNGFSSVGFGIMFIVMSLFCRYGAESAQKKNEEE